MDWLSQLDAQKFLLFTLVFSRVGGLVITAPVFSTPEVPARVRAVLAVALAALIMPTQWDVAVADPGSTLNYLVFLASELIVGLSLGLGIVVLFSGLLLAGRLIGQMSGLVLADVFDPASGISVSVFSRLMLLVTTAVFVAIGGHRMLMAGLLDTFVTIPPGRAAVPGSMADTFVLLVAESFALAVRAAAPVVASLLLSTLALGLISRTLPQLNVLALGFGVNALLTFGVLGLSLGAATWVFQEQVEPAVEIVLSALHAPLETTGGP